MAKWMADMKGALQGELLVWHSNLLTPINLFSTLVLPRGPSLVEMSSMITEIYFKFEIWQKIIPEILEYLCKL